MPRIDPQQLLNCLQVLLSPTGGILSKNEVQRLANLMTKFSKKLVSKCIYVLILKRTEIPLLGQFMGEGGWNLIHLWLQDAHINKNWALVSEVLELLLITPVDVERLKMNNLPKLVKSLTKRDDLPGIQQLATSLVELWLTIVKDVTKQEQMVNQQQVIAAFEKQPKLMIQHKTLLTIPAPVSEISDDPSDDPEPMDIDETIGKESKIIVAENGVDTLLNMQLIRDDEQVISRVVPSISNDSSPEELNKQSADVPNPVVTDVSSNKNEDSEGTDKENSDDKDKKLNAVPKKSSSSNSSSNSSKTSSSSSRDKDRDNKSRDKSKSSSSSRSSSSKSSSSSRDKDRKDRDKDRHRHNGSSSSSSSSTSSSRHRSSSSKSSTGSSLKDVKEKQAERDKDTLAKLQPQAISKLGRIPKKNEDSKKDGKSEEKKEAKKSSFSVEVRKDTEEKPKTVKVYNSKLRSTGLLEEAKPPLPRSATKKTAPPPVIPANIPTKRPSPIRDAIPPPEKKSRLMDPEKGIKLIPPKPKPAVLQESDIFMDALAASATAKKEPKKRKRRTSVSKDSSPPASPSTKPPTSPTVLKNITPANFYQDTLVTTDTEELPIKESEKDNESKDDDNNTPDDKEIEKVVDTPAEPEEDSSPVETTRTDANGLKGVLSYAKRKGPKRSIRWRPDADLVDIQYFELDETERVNVMKPFMDMQRIEMNSEREALRQRKLPNEDTMESQMQWRLLVEIEAPAPPAEIGSKSQEKNIQFAREKRVLQAIYFNNRMPDAPDEPDVEINPISANVIIIPLTDPDQPEQEAPIQPWPEAKGSPPHISAAPPLFTTVPPQFIPVPANFTPNGLPQFTPSFAPPVMITRPPGDWNLMPNGIPPNIPPPEMIQQVPPIFDSFVGPHGPPDGHFGPPFGGPNPMPQMFPPNQFNNNMRGRGGFRRGGPNNPPWMRMGPPPNQGGWNNNQSRGRGFCNSFKQKGFCRNRDNCPYIH